MWPPLVLNEHRENTFFFPHIYSGTHYLRSIGFGPTLDSDPLAKTVFFLCKIVRVFPHRHSSRVKFLFDILVGAVLDTVEEAGPVPVHVVLQVVVRLYEVVWGDVRGYDGVRGGMMGYDGV